MPPLPTSTSSPFSARVIVARAPRRRARSKQPTVVSASAQTKSTVRNSTTNPSSPISGVAAALADVATRATAAFRLPRPRDFPPGPAEDLAPSFLSDPLGTLESLEARYGGVVGVVLGGERVVVVGGGGARRAAADVLLDPNGSFAKQGTAFFPGSDVTGNGLLTSDGDSWKRQRALATPAFRRAAVEAYGSAMASEAEATAERDWREYQTRDLYRDFNALTLRVVTTALFGYSLGEGGEGARIASAVDAAFARFAAAGVLGGSGSSGSELVLSLLPQWGGDGSKNAFEKAVADLDEVVYEIIASRRRKVFGGEGGGRRKDDDASAAPCLLDAMLRATDEETGESMSDSQLRDELLTMLIAGQETSAAVLSWSAALLAHHPRVQEEVASEIDEVFGDEGVGGRGEPSSTRRRPLVPSDAGKLPKLEAVLLESMRLLPPAYIVGRHARDGALISRGGGGGGGGGSRKKRASDVDDNETSPSSPSSSSFWRLPPKTSVLVSPYLLHRDAESWGPNPRRFSPFERWLPLLPEREGSGGGGPGGLRSMPLLAGLGPNGCYVPFGAGPRVCIGASFAMLEGVLVLAALLRVARLEPASPSDEDGGEGRGENVGGRVRFPAAEPRLTLRPASTGVRLRLIPRRGE